MLKTIEILVAIHNNSPEGIILIAPDYKVIAFNKTYRDQIYSFTGKTIKIDDDSREFVIPENKDVFLTNFKKAVKGENIVLQFESKTNTTPTWFEYRMNPVYNTSEELIGVTLTSKNIDKEKKAEIEVEKLSETIKAIFENTVESIILIDQNYTILNFNKTAYYRIQKRNNKELYIGGNFNDFLYEGTQDLFHKLFENALLGKIYTGELEFNLRGETIWLKTRFQPVYKPNKELLGIAVFNENITESKLAEIALIESEEKFKKIVESTPTPIVIADANLNIILTNSETEKVFNFKAEELYGKNIRLLIPKHPITHTSFTDNNLKEHTKHSTSVTKNGKEILIETGLSTFVLNGKKYIIAIIQDVTQRIKYEEQIANQLNRLQAIAWQQSHEIRRPLTNILGLFELMKLEPKSTEAEKQKYLDLVYQSAIELDSIIHNIVDHTC